MKKFILGKIGKSFEEENIKYLMGLDPIKRLDTFYILPNFYSLKETREKIIEGYQAVHSDNIMSIDDLVESYKDPNKTYLDQEVLVFIIKNLLEEKNQNLSLELTEIILDLKSQGLYPKDLENLEEDYKDLENLGKIYKSYQDFLEEKGLFDKIDLYIQARENLRKIKNKEIIINGFTEFRRVEWDIIKALGENNQVTIQYPFITERKNKVTEKAIEIAKSLGFSIEEAEDEEKNSFNLLAYKYLTKAKLDPVRAEKICGSTKLYEVKSVFRSIKKDLESLEAEDISLIIPKDYEELVKIVALEEDIKISSMNKKPGKKISLIKSVLNFLDFVETEDKQSLISFLENKYISDIETSFEEKRLIRRLDYKGLAYNYQDLDLLEEDKPLLGKIKEIFASLNTIIEKIRENPASALGDYLEERKIPNKIYDHYKDHQNKETFITSIKAIQLLEKTIKEVENLSSLLGLTKEDQLEFLKEKLENSSYYQKDYEEGVGVFQAINAIGLKDKKRYILGLNLDYPARKKTSYFYNKSFSGAYKKLGFYVEDSRHYMDNEILKFSQALTNTQGLAFSYTGEADVYSVFLQALDRFLEKDKTRQNDALQDQAIKDLLEGKDLVAIEEDKARDLNNLFIAREKSLEGDLDYFGKVTFSSRPMKRYSPARLDTYNRCPYRFFMKYINRLEALELDYEDTEYLDKGNLYHKILEDFIKNNKNLEDLSDEEIETKLEKILENYKDHLSYWAIKEPVIRNNIFSFLLETREKYKSLEGKITPLYFEKEYRKNLGDFYLEGRVDRVDQTEKGDLLIFDYKSGKTPSATGARKLDFLQLPIYGYLTDKDLGGLFYVALTEDKKYKGVILEESLSPKKTKEVFSKTEILDFLKSTEDKIIDLDGKINQGDFIPNSENESYCNNCSYKDMCHKEDLDESK